MPMVCEMGGREAGTKWDDHGSAVVIQLCIKCCKFSKKLSHHLLLVCFHKFSSSAWMREHYVYHHRTMPLWDIIYMLINLITIVLLMNWDSNVSESDVQFAMRIYIPLSARYSYISRWWAKNSWWHFIWCTLALSLPLYTTYRLCAKFAINPEILR